MTLPIMSSTIYNTTIPSTGEKIKYRPFTVREQKSLLVAQQSEDQNVMIDTLKTVITSCVVEKINVAKLAIFDLEYIFIQIRAKSVGELIELVFECDSCHETTNIKFDLTKLEVSIPENHTKNIDLGDNKGLVMKYPDIDVLKLLTDFDDTDTELIFRIMVSCIDSIYDEQTIHNADDYNAEELYEFVNSFSIAQFAKVQAFFDTLPILEQKVIYDCPKCRHHHDKSMKGITNFF